MRDRRITKKLVDRLRPAGADYFVWDNTLIGFGVRVQPTGLMSYIVKYRAGSGRGAPTRRVTLGRVGTLTPDEARTLARKTLGAVAHGNDPAALRAAERRASTLREVAEIFLAEHVEAKRKRTTPHITEAFSKRSCSPSWGAARPNRSRPSTLPSSTRKCGTGPIRQIACWRLSVASIRSPANARFCRSGSIRLAASNNILRRDASVT